MPIINVSMLNLFWTICTVPVEQEGEVIEDEVVVEKVIEEEVEVEKQEEVVVELQEVKRINKENNKKRNKTRKRSLTRSSNLVKQIKQYLVFEHLDQVK